MAYPTNRCRNCGTHVGPRRAVHPRYCPHCGADLPESKFPEIPTAPGAHASWILGAVSFCIPFAGLATGVIAIGLGLNARERIKNSHALLRGEGPATVGIILGSLACLIWLAACLGVGR